MNHSRGGGTRDEAVQVRPLLSSLRRAEVRARHTSTTCPAAIQTHKRHQNPPIPTKTPLDAFTSSDAVLLMRLSLSLPLAFSLVASLSLHCHGPTPLPAKSSHSPRSSLPRPLYKSSSTGFSMCFLNDLSHAAPMAPSTTRWSDVSDTSMTDLVTKGLVAASGPSLGTTFFSAPPTARMHAWSRWGEERAVVRMGSRRRGAMGGGRGQRMGEVYMQASEERDARARVRLARAWQWAWQCVVWQWAWQHAVAGGGAVLGGRCPPAAC